MKKLFQLSLLGMIAISSTHAGVLDKKHAKDVKKVALISLYANRRVLLAQPRDTGSGWEYLDPTDDKSAAAESEHESWAGKNQSDTEIGALYQQGVDMFQHELGQIPNWEFLPYESIAKISAYQNFYKARQEQMQETLNGMPSFLSKLAEKKAMNAAGPGVDPSRYHVDEGMIFVPMSLVTDGVKRFGTDPFAEQKKSLGQLATDLGVDGVAIITMRISHRYGKLARLKVGDHVKAVPRIGSHLLVIDRNGRIVVDTGPVLTKIQDEHEGGSVSLIQDGKMRLDDPSVQEGFKTAMAASATKMKEIISKAYEKLK